MSLKICILSACTEDEDAEQLCCSVKRNSAAVGCLIIYFLFSIGHIMFEENNVLNSPADSGLQCCFIPLSL